jgi:hypothetical protein
MSRDFSINREFDYVRLDGLRRATGRPPHEWDLYIAKELIDNALDADEILWRCTTEKTPSIRIVLEYIPIPKRKSQFLNVQVGNRKAFPTEQIENIFDTKWYTSRKAFMKGLMRGALGNALKTLLGIPYALRNPGGWEPVSRPFSLRCGEMEYLLHYKIHPTTQQIVFMHEAKQIKVVEGTIISVGLDHFEQEEPLRTMTDIKELAQQYHLCNPHAQFSWEVIMGDQKWTQVYPANPQWANKFLDMAPVHWYSVSAFQDVLAALYRKQSEGEENCKAEDCKITVEDIYRCFVDDSPEVEKGSTPLATIMRSLGQNSLTEADITGPSARKLYQIIYEGTAHLDPDKLGCIGEEHVRASLAAALPLEGNIFYKKIGDTDPADSDRPFVIEAAVAPLTEGKRRVWTAINFSPTYDDPFRSRRLSIPFQPGTLVMGIRELLDVYGLLDETPIVLFLHLICPSIEYQESSKTEINHLPFKKALCELLDRLLIELRNVQDKEAAGVQEAVYQVLDGIMNELHANEHFILAQLHEKVYRQLWQQPIYAAWLERPDAQSRLQGYINDYMSRSAALSAYVAHRALASLSVPQHPGGYLSYPIQHISRDLLEQYCVNKILYVQERELESVVIDNGWLCRMDMAFLRNPAGHDGLQEALVQCVIGSDLPILIWHDADEAGQSLIGQVRTWLKERQLDEGRIIDLGLFSEESSAEAHNLLRRLVEMMPSEQITWLLQRFEVLGIRVKAIPPDTDILKAIRERIERQLREILMEGMRLKIDLPRLLREIDREVGITSNVERLKLDEEVRTRLQQESSAESYTAVVDKVVAEFFTNILSPKHAVIQHTIHAHTTYLHEREWL